MNYFSKNIRYLRKQNNMSQDALADILNYKSFTTIQKWESDKSEPTLSTLNKLSKIFNVSIEDLVNVNLENKNLIEDKLSSPSLSRDEKTLLDNYNKSNTTGKTIILDTSVNISKAYPMPSRQEMIDYIKSFKRAAYGGAKNPYDMTDEELEEKYYQYKEDFEDD